ncbi:MAG TPA: 4-phosphoerythronate dehydrogenase, partial [Thiomicrospira sp.]|nr:4-phosphoerythronate dehydrogenase [Thiomicrospira sp.]
TQINSALLKDSQVSFVGSTVVGLDHIDQPYLKEQGIHFYSAQGCNANSVAEYIITCLLITAEKHQFNLYEKTLAIIGVGNVGSLVFKKAQALGINCLLNDPPKVKQQPEFTNSYTDLENCLKADIITVHTPLTTQGNYPTKNLIDRQFLSKISPNQIIINAARGGIIDEQAWSETETLANIIDCWVNEPMINESLYNKADIATPHIAGHSLDAKIAGTEMVYQQLCKFWKVTPQEDWKTALPPQPSIINAKSAGNLQKQLLKICTETYNPLMDDQAIRSSDIQKLYKSYEKYRRNYPIHREWEQHIINTKNNEILNNLLISLGFQAH